MSTSSSAASSSAARSTPSPSTITVSAAAPSAALGARPQRSWRADCFFQRLVDRKEELQALMLRFFEEKCAESCNALYPEGCKSTQAVRLLALAFRVPLLQREGCCCAQTSLTSQSSVRRWTRCSSSRSTPCEAPALLDHSVDLDLEPAMLDFTSRFGDSCPVLNDCRCVCL